MEPTNFRHLDHLSKLRRLHRSGLRTVHGQGYVRAPMIIIRHVAREHALEVPFVEDLIAIGYQEKSKCVGQGCACEEEMSRISTDMGFREPQVALPRCQR
jgi:hypothetical protein